MPRPASPSTLQRVLRALDAADAQARSAALDAGRRAGAGSGGSSSAAAPSFAQGMANAFLNRWADILPYDHAMLPGPYLNASLVRGLEPAARAFVASQAPPPHTYAAFFAALVAHDVRLLVNLTALEEHGRTKADAYWPRADGRWHAVAGSEWAVCTAGERRVGGPDAGELTRRVLRLRHGAAGPVHEVVQLHLTSWADHGSSSAAAFRALIAAIDAEAQHGAVADAAAAQPPLWVHCSAGVGRSGTLIGALLARDAPAATRQLADAAPASPSSGGLFAAVMARVQSNDEQLPPPTRAARDIVAHMRQARPCMVQTPAQLGMLVEQVQGVLQPPEPQK